MSATNTEINRFRTELLQDISDLIESDKTGGIREEKFTEVILEYMEEAGETEAAIPCREIRENSIGNRVHKINGYALSEGYETVDLFITIFKGTSELGRLYADDIRAGINLSTRFLQNILTGKMEGIEETAPVFDFVQTMHQISKDIVRVNIYVLSDMLIPTEVPDPSEMGDLQIHYHFRDIEYIHRIHTSGTGKQAIEINFTESFGEAIPCLPTPEKNEDYESYLCVIPARILASIYKDHGARLLEQNVRTFLQFRGTINKGIRDTILREPHMFMAYNNGISATAESIEISGDSKSIVSIRDFQIVNGGQTTASIFQTQRKYKDANINAVCVQVKLTVIRDLGKKPEIVSLISKYANTQNKVSEADFSSNHPFHIELEYLSRKVWTPASSGKSQTRWYYERARGQYNDELSQIDRKAQQKKWLARNPKHQKFAKEDLAKFDITWEMGPWWVVRGRQRNFIEFMKSADETDVSNNYYEDLIARAILYRTAERLYGTGAKAIGDLRYMVVPYTLSLLRHLTNGHLHLQK
ncbi:AIPR family protein, partial [uncultured Fluviicola sp.]|uniref:AIPR family protein n=1 Tax=uncultured Fluviicola sp. TaxID=463303 RepID=UPI0025F06C1D